MDDIEPNDPEGNISFFLMGIYMKEFLMISDWSISGSTPAKYVKDTPITTEYRLKSKESYKTYSLSNFRTKSKTNNIVNRIRLYVGGQNNMLITNWQGIDPVNDVYPLPKSYFVGLNATF